MDLCSTVRANARSTRIRVERDAADRPSRAVQRRVEAALEQLAEVRHLEEQMTVADAVDRDREEQNGQHREKAERRGRAGGHGRVRRVHEQLLRHDHREDRQRQEHERRQHAARLDAEVRPHREQRQRHEVAEDEEADQVHLGEDRESRCVTRHHQHPRLEQQHAGQRRDRARDAEDREERAEQIPRRQQRRHAEEHDRGAEPGDEADHDRPRRPRRERAAPLQRRERHARTLHLAQRFRRAGQREKQAECRAGVEQKLRHR